jgi:alpha-tubulin suppressor-like RCC1 family protein
VSLKQPVTSIEEVTAGGFHTCVANANNVINCWGLNDSGQLGVGSTATVGDQANEMGAFLVDVVP